MTSNRASLRLPRAAVFLLASAGILACASYEPRALHPESRAAAFAARTLADPQLLLFLKQQLGESADPRAASDESLSAAIQQFDLKVLRYIAYYEHPRVAEAAAKLQIKNAAVETAGARPNPSLSVAPEHSLNPPRGDSPWTLPISVNFTIETAGKRDARVAAAEIDRAVAEVEWRSAGWSAARSVRPAVAQWAASRDFVNNTERELAARERILAIIIKRIEAGAARELDAAEQRQAIATIHARRASEWAALADASVELAMALALPASAMEQLQPPAMPPADGAELFLSSNGHSTEKAFVKLGLRTRADISISLLEYQYQEALLRLEIAKQYPDIQLGPGYQYDQGQNKITLGLSLDLPIFNKNEGPIAQARAERDAAAAHFDTIQISAIHELERAFVHYKSIAASKATLARAREQMAHRLDVTKKRIEAGEDDALAGALADLESAQLDRSSIDLELEIQQSIAALEDALQCPLDEAALKK